MKPTVDTYINSFSGEVRETLTRIRKTIKKAIPDADEKLFYGLPAFYHKGLLLSFGAYKNHIGVYPTPAAIEHFKDELSVYKIAKGSIQFPHNAELPYSLIEEIAKFRFEEKK